MRITLCTIVVALAVAGCSGSQTASTFTLADGTVYTDTDCHAADQLLIGGYDASDGLPVRGETDQARVEAEYAAVREHLITKTGVVAVNVVPRNGEVWFRLADGDYAVELVEDFQYEVVLDADGVCPTAPNSVNGVPVIYNRADA
jgi:hypothetical protein